MSSTIFLTVAANVFAMQSDKDSDYDPNKETEQKTTRQSPTWGCIPCGFKTNDARELYKHLRPPEHKAKIGEILKSSTKMERWRKQAKTIPNSCELCLVHYQNPFGLRSHNSAAHSSTVLEKKTSSTKRSLSDMGSSSTSHDRPLKKQHTVSSDTISQQPTTHCLACSQEIIKPQDIGEHLKAEEHMHKLSEISQSKEKVYVLLDAVRASSKNTPTCVLHYVRFQNQSDYDQHMKQSHG